MHEYSYFTDLPIVSWNIHGIFSRYSGFKYNKLHSPHFKSAVGNAKIFGLLETHHVATDIDQLQLTGFKCYNVCRKKKMTTTSRKLLHYAEASLSVFKTKMSQMSQSGICPI